MPNAYENRIRPRSGVTSFSAPVARREDGKYEVQPNDSYWTISERLYGSGAYFKALAEHNRGKGLGEEKLRPGDLVLAPAVEELEKSYPDLCPKPGRREARAEPGPGAQRRQRPAVPQRPNLHRGRGGHPVQHRPLRVGQGLAVGGNLRVEPARVGQRLQLSHARHSTGPSGQRKARHVNAASGGRISAVGRWRRQIGLDRHW